MMILRGKGICGGVAFGRMRFYGRNAAEAVYPSARSRQEELARFESARATALSQLDALFRKAVDTVGEQGGMIFDTHRMMLEDEDYIEAVRQAVVRDGASAEGAVELASDRFSRIFSELDDVYMKERAADVRDISLRLLDILGGREREGLVLDAPVILVADDLSPSETVQLDRSKILAFVTAGGSVYSHTAILARAMGIPAVVGLGVELTREMDGRHAIVDGEEGKLYIDPVEAVAAKMERRRRWGEERGRLLDELKDMPDVTLDGRQVLVCANIGSVDELEAALENGAGGVGLFRSEFLFLGRGSCPSEEEQFAVYKKIAEGMAGKRVVFRTLDIGADKRADYLELHHEENPALGLRALRLCLTRPELLKTQLRAIYRASAYGEAAIMFPMVASVNELCEAKKIALQVREELKTDGIPFDRTARLGVMVETPAAAVISDLLAAQADFFSIGTNDLSQYTLALDRQNRNLEQFYDSGLEAVLRLVKMTVENARAAGVRVSVCGELAADTSFTEVFLRMGVDELSVAPSAILAVRAKIRAYSAASGTASPPESHC